MIHSWTSGSVEETEAIGALLATSSAEPVTIGLIGDLGAGKTALVRGFVAELSPDLATWVNSPTYAVCNEYPSSPPVFHYDLYRLGDADDLEGVAYRETEGMWRLVEWVDRIPEALESADIVLRFARLPGAKRRVVLEAQTASGRRLEVALGSAQPAK